jgi:recombination protein RecT
MSTNGQAKSLAVRRNEVISAMFTDAFKSSLAAIAPPTMKGLLAADRVKASLALAMTRNPALANCTPGSIAQCALQCVELGLLPGMPRSGWLVPYKDQCSLIISYQAMIDLALRSGACKSIVAYPVYSNDEFEAYLGSEPRMVHRPAELGTPKGELIGVYARAVLMTGGEVFKILDLEAVDAHKARSKAATSGPWVTDYEAMALKTAVRVLCNFLPQTPDLLAGLAADDESQDLTRPLDVAIDGVAPIAEVRPPLDAPRLSGKGGKAKRGQAPTSQDAPAVAVDGGDEPISDPVNEIAAGYKMTEKQAEFMRGYLGVYDGLTDRRLAEIIKDCTEGGVVNADRFDEEIAKVLRS